ncbi:hypothetical protein [Arthrobacter sp. H-02-3]|uniref:hypothetical protein n=1 Tax=Arthrobacter sp. H-02-3 TaxID=2703675 RepID=UPI000DD24A9A|nr:hypothetical protein [Arthrobacter sp. H-02-3]PVZ55200.1 hypothetical protein C9424_14155 [Arthrobacter sp. H-02-3]
MTVVPTNEYIKAAEAYADTLRNWAKVHLAWSNGEATIEQDREAYAQRQAAFEAFKRAEAKLSPRADEREINRAVNDYAYDIDALADEPNH